MQFDNFKKVEDEKCETNDIRKGVVGDWVNHFTKDMNTEFNAWIVGSLQKIGIQDSEVVKYFQLDVPL